MPENTPLLHDFPESIDALEIDLQPALDIIDSEGAVNAVDGATRSIVTTHFSPPTLECAIALNTGDLLVYRRKPTSVRQVDETHDTELRLLKHVIVEPWRKLAPYFALRRSEGGSIVSVALSEIGKLVALVD